MHRQRKKWSVVSRSIQAQAKKEVVSGQSQYSGKGAATRKTKHL